MAKGSHDTFRQSRQQMCVVCICRDLLDDGSLGWCYSHSRMDRKVLVYLTREVPCLRALRSLLQKQQQRDIAHFMLDHTVPCPARPCPALP